MDNYCEKCRNRKTDLCYGCTTSYSSATGVTDLPTNFAERVADNVNHPAHYDTGKFECVDVMVETQGVESVKDFCLCNAFKYLYRHNGKNGVEDIKKAKWYIEKYLELEGESE